MDIKYNEKIIGTTDLSELQMANYLSCLSDFKLDTIRSETAFMEVTNHDHPHP